MDLSEKSDFKNSMLNLKSLYPLQVLHFVNGTLDNSAFCTPFHLEIISNIMGLIHLDRLFYKIDTISYLFFIFI